MSLSWIDTGYDYSFLTANSKTCIYVERVFEKVEELGDKDLYDFFANEVFIYEEDKLSSLNIKIYINENYSENDEDMERLKLIIDKILAVMYEYMIPVENERVYDEDKHRYVFKKIEEFSECIRTEYTNIDTVNKSKKYINELKEEVIKLKEEKEKMIELFFKEVEEKKLDMVQTTNEFMETSKKDLNELKKDVYKEIIAIVGIFTAISFGAFGGMSLLNELFSNVGKIGLNDLIIIGCISGIFILTLVYIIIDYLSKLIGIKIEEIDKDKTRFCNFRRNHTPLYFSYLFITIILIGTCIFRYKK